MREVTFSIGLRIMRPAKCILALAAWFASIGIPIDPDKVASLFVSFCKVEVAPCVK